MALSQKSPVFESEAERRGKIASDTPGEYVFNDQNDAVKLVQGQVREAHMPYKRLAEGGNMSGSTVSNMASGKTRFPRFSTMFGLLATMDIEVLFRRRNK